MTVESLTVNQRWLLRVMGSWAIRDCLISPAGVDHLMTSQWGGTGHRVDGAPEWMHSFQCGNGKIVCPAFTEPIVTITRAQLNRYARELPSSVTDELRAVARAMHAAQQRTWEWCRCPYEHTPPNQHTGVCRSYHPTHQQEDAHFADVHRLDDWQDRALNRALGFVEITDAESVGQLELFEVAS